MGAKRLLTGLALVASFLLPLNSLGVAVTSSSKSSVNLQELATGYNHFNSNSFSGVKLTYNEGTNSQLILEPVGTNSLEGIVVGGSFDVPFKIWEDRWNKYNPSVNTRVDPAVSNGLLGMYLLQPFSINRRAVWKQPSGKNFVWFGDLCNPRDSFDVWYVGQYPAQQVPRARYSIPVIPTFSPNHIGLDSDSLFSPWSKKKVPGEPTFKKTVVDISHFYRLSKDDPFTQITNKLTKSVSPEQMNSLELLTHYSSPEQLDSFEEVVSLELERLFFKSIKLTTNGVELIWNSYTNYLYNVSRATNLQSSFSVIGTNIPGLPIETKFSDDQPLLNSGFYNVKGDKRISP